MMLVAKRFHTTTESLTGRDVEMTAKSSKRSSLSTWKYPNGLSRGWNRNVCGIGGMQPLVPDKADTRSNTQR